MESRKTKWGNWKVTAEGANWKQKILEIDPGKFTSLQYHQQRSEVWVVVSGVAEFYYQKTDGENGTTFYTSTAFPTETLYIPLGSVHQIRNPHPEEPLIISEVQYGNCFEEDIIRLEEGNNQ